MPSLNESDEELRAANEACRGGRHWKARWLLRKWRPDPRYSYGKTPVRELLLHRVVEKGYVALIQGLLPKQNPIKDDFVRDAIHGEAPIPVLELFLARGWEINSNSENPVLRYVEQGAAFKKTHVVADKIFLAKLSDKAMRYLLTGCSSMEHTQTYKRMILALPWF